MLIGSEITNNRETMSDDPKKPDPQETFRAGIKAAVGAANSALAGMEKVAGNIREPAVSTWNTISTQSTVAMDAVSTTYQKRHQYAPEIIAGSTVLGGGIMALRRGRIAGVLGATLAGGTAYAVVYDQFAFQDIPDVLFGKK